MANQPGLSEAEREVLKVLWDHGPATVRSINEVLERRGRNWAYTTVATLLQRLAAKQFLVSDSSAIPHLYRATVSREELLERRLKDAADELCDGQAVPLVLALVQGNRFSPEELARLRRMLDIAAADPAPKTKPKTLSRSSGIDRFSRLIAIQAEGRQRRCQGYGGSRRRQWWRQDWPPWRYWLAGCDRSGRRSGTYFGWWFSSN